MLNRNDQNREARKKKMKRLIEKKKQKTIKSPLEPIYDKIYEEGIVWVNSLK